MFKLLQNEYEEYQEYFKELELIQRQYNQEEAYHFIINKLIRDSINDKDISVRDVHKVSTLTGENANKLSGRNEYLIGYDGQAPDFVILHNDFEESKGGNQSDKVYGCVEIKPFSEAKRQGKDTRKLYSEYISPIKNLLENKELVEGVEVAHEKLWQNRIKIEFESLEKKEEFIEKYSQGKKKSIPISLENGGITRKGKVLLCGRSKDLCLQIEENESIKFEEGQIKQLKIGMRNNEVVLVPRDSETMECEYLVELKRKKIIEKLCSQEKKEGCNTIICEILKELIGFRKVIFTNGYQWILMQCQCDNKDSEDKKITVNAFQCKSLANFYPEPKKEETFKNLKMKQCQDMSDMSDMSEKLDAEKQKLKIPLTEFQKDEDFKAWTAMTFAELQQHNFKQWLHLKFEINRIFKEAKSQNKQGEEKIGNDE